MARSYIIILSVVLLIICYVQAAPAPEQENTTAAASDLDMALNKLKDTLSNGFKSMMENPELDKILKEGKKLLDNAAQNIQAGAEKLIPKTDGSSAPVA